MPNSCDNLIEDTSPFETIEDTSLLNTEVSKNCLFDCLLAFNFFPFLTGILLATICSLATTKTAKAAVLTQIISSTTTTKALFQAQRDESVVKNKVFVANRIEPRAIQAFPRSVGSKPSHVIVRKDNSIRASVSKKKEFDQWWVRENAQALTESETKIPESSTELPFQERVKDAMEGMAQKVGEVVDYTLDGSDDYIGLSEDQKETKRRVLLNGAEFQVIPYGGQIMDKGIQIDNHSIHYESATQQEAHNKLLRPLLIQKAKAEAEKVEADVKKTDTEVKVMESKEIRKKKESNSKQVRKDKESEARIKRKDQESEAKQARKAFNNTAKQKRKQELHQAKLKRIED